MNYAAAPAIQPLLHAWLAITHQPLHAWPAIAHQLLHAWLTITHQPLHAWLALPIKPWRTLALALLAPLALLALLEPSPSSLDTLATNGDSPCESEKFKPISWNFRLLVGTAHEKLKVFSDRPRRLLPLRQCHAHRTETLTNYRLLRLLLEASAQQPHWPLPSTT